MSVTSPVQLDSQRSLESFGTLYAPAESLTASASSTFQTHNLLIWRINNGNQESGNPHSRTRKKKCCQILHHSLFPRLFSYVIVPAACYKSIWGTELPCCCRNPSYFTDFVAYKLGNSFPNRRHYPKPTLHMARKATTMTSSSFPRNIVTLYMTYSAALQHTHTFDIAGVLSREIKDGVV